MAHRFISGLNGAFCHIFGGYRDYALG